MTDAKRLAVAAAAALSLMPGCAKAPPKPEPPAARVEASSGPVRITFELYRTSATLRRVSQDLSDGRRLVWDHAPFHFRATLTNISTRPIAGSGDIFFDTRNMGGPPGVFIEIRDPNGKAVQPLPYYADFHRPPVEEARKLEPGQTLTTPEWTLLHAPQVPGYASAPFRLSHPGRYRLRLVYDYTPLKRLTAKIGLPPDPTEIRFATDELWLDVVE